jgi:hypothetical protein
MPTHIALLRGINVGGRNRVAMADLRAVVLGLGHTDVATYIQSGNVVFTSEEADTGDDRGGAREERRADRIRLIGVSTMPAQCWAGAGPLVTGVVRCDLVVRGPDVAPVWPGPTSLRR